MLGGMKMNFIKSERQIIRIVIIFAVITMFNSCRVALGVKNLGVADKTVPKEQLVTLFIPEFYKVTKFNDKSVKWKGRGSGQIGVIKVPIGEHMIKYNYLRDIGGFSHPGIEIGGIRDVRTIYVKRDITDFDKEITMVFEPDKMYIVDKETIIEYNGGPYTKIKFIQK